MLKKNLKYFNTLLILLISICSCKNTNHIEVFNEVNENINNYPIVDSVNNINFYFLKTIKRTVYKNCLFTKENIGFDTLNNVIFDNCNFLTNENVDLRVGNFENVEFNNCSFNSLSIKNSDVKNNLKITNCKAKEILIDQTQFNGISIIAFKDTINKIRVQGCSNSSRLDLTGYVNNIILEGGEIHYLDVANLTNNNTKLIVFSTYLINPNFVNKSAKNYSILLNSSIENATLSADKNSILKEEIEWQDKNTKDASVTERNEIKKGYLVSKSVYSYLSKVFESEKKYDLADYFYFRSKVCEREINSEGLGKYFEKFFNENIRGDYGTNYLRILITFLVITLIFSFLYFLLGYFKFAFGYYLKTKLFGETSENEKPVLLTYHRNKFGFIPFTINCLIFSLNNMVLGGLSNGFHFYNFTTMYLFPPRKYGTIGIGRIFSIIQSLIGLILVFFFITSFLRLTR